MSGRPDIESRLQYQDGAVRKRRSNSNVENNNREITGERVYLTDAWFERPSIRSLRALLSGKANDRTDASERSLPGYIDAPPKWHRTTGTGTLVRLGVHRRMVSGVDAS